MNNLYSQTLGIFENNYNVYCAKDKNNIFMIDVLNELLKQQGISHEEVKLEASMHVLRRYHTFNTILNSAPFYPALPFYSVKKYIESCPLYSCVFRKMPKVGLLHIHSPASLSAEGLIDMIIEWDKNSNDLTHRQIYYLPYSCGRRKAGSFIYGLERDKDLELKSVGVRAKHANDDIGLKDKMISMITFNKRTESVDYIWDEFNDIFQRTDELFKCEDFFRDYHEKAFREMLEDKISYVELRCSFPVFEKALEKVPVTGKTQSFYFLEVLKESAQKVNSIENPFKLRVILNAKRSIDDFSIVRSKIDNAIEAQKRHPGFVIGFDFVSEEDRGYTTSKYASTMYDVYSGKDETCKDKSRISQIDYYLHAGESNWVINHNILCAGMTSRYRIGHGFNLCEFPTAAESFIADSAAGSGTLPPMLEICPISNQELRYVPDLRKHPARQLFRRNIRCVIANDDPQIFGNKGLSYDFWETYVGMDMCLYEIKEMVMNSLDCKTQQDYNIISISESTNLQREEAPNFQANRTYFNKNDWHLFVIQALDALIKSPLYKIALDASFNREFVALAKEKELI